MDILFTFLHTVRNSTILSYIVYAPCAELADGALEHLDTLLARVHIEEVVGENEVGVGGVDLNVLGEGVSLYYDLVALESKLELGIYEVEVLGCSEEDGALGYHLVVHNELEGVIVLTHVGLVEVHLVEVEHGVGCNAHGVHGLAERLTCIITQSSDDDAVDGPQRIVGDAERYLGLVVIVIGLHDNVGACSLFSDLCTGDEHGGEESLGVVVERLESAVVVDARPGRYGPDIVELPVECAHTSASVAAQVLNAVFHSLSLKELRCVQQGAELGGIEEGLGEIAQDLAVGTCVSLVQLHNAGEYVSVLGQGDGVDSLLTGEGLEAELGEVTEVVIAVLGEGLVVVPYLPIVRVTEVLVVGVDEST